MYLSPFMRRLVFALGLVFVIGSGWLSYATNIVAGDGILHSSEESLSHSSLSTVNNGIQSPRASPDEDSLSDGGDLQQLTQGLHPGRGDPIPDAKDIHELPVVDVSFYNKRGYLLSGWLAVHSPLVPVIILTHGTPGNRLSMVQRAAFLYNHGYNVLLFDFQSYGLSQGIMSTLGMVESEDILAAIDYLHSRPETSHSKIGVLGLSMGATAAALAASKTNTISALVLESCPVDATRVLGDVPNDAARDADKQLVEKVYDVDITKARPVDAVEKLPGHSALFFINGDADTTTPLAGMQKLYQMAGDPKQYWVVPSAGHAQSFDIDSAGYIAKVDAFFDTYLSYSGL